MNYDNSGIREEAAAEFSVAEEPGLIDDAEKLHLEESQKDKEKVEHELTPRERDLAYKPLLPLFFKHLMAE